MKNLEDKKRLIFCRIVEARHQKKLTQAQLAEALGKPLKTWQKVEQGKTSVLSEELPRINAKLGNLRIDYYFNPNMTYQEAAGIEEVDLLRERMKSQPGFAEIIEFLLKRPPAELVEVLDWLEWIAFKHRNKEPSEHAENRNGFQLIKGGQSQKKNAAKAVSR